MGPSRLPVGHPTSSTTRVTTFPAIPRAYWTAHPCSAPMTARCYLPWAAFPRGCAPPEDTARSTRRSSHLATSPLPRSAGAVHSLQSLPHAHAIGPPPFRSRPRLRGRLLVQRYRPSAPAQSRGALEGPAEVRPGAARAITFNVMRWAPQPLESISEPFRWSRPGRSPAGWAFGPKSAGAYLAHQPRPARIGAAPFLVPVHLRQRAAHRFRRPPGSTWLGRRPPTAA